jgi:hypothetical protein
MGGQPVELGGAERGVASLVKRREIDRMAAVGATEGSKPQRKEVA